MPAKGQSRRGRLLPVVIRLPQCPESGRGVRASASVAKGQLRTHALQHHLVGMAVNDHANREWSGYLTARMMVKSARRRTMLRVQRRTPGQRVAKNRHVRRQLCRPRSFPLSQNLARCCTKQCNRVPKLRLFRAPPPKSTHPQPPFTPTNPSILTNWGSIV
jgi:hypothetical protein